MRFLGTARSYVSIGRFFLHHHSASTVFYRPLSSSSTLCRLTMTRPILVSSQDYLDINPVKRSESPETILDSEEERQEFYIAQREKRRARKLEKRGSGSGESSGSAEGSVRKGKAREDDSVRFVGTRKARSGGKRVMDDDDEIEVIGVVPTAPVLRAPATTLSAPESDTKRTEDEPSMDDDTPTGLRANLAKFKYARPVKGDTKIPTSRAAVAAIKARAALVTVVDRPAETSASGSGKKRVVKGKTSVPEMPIAPEQLRELDACVVCDMTFDRRKTAKTRWVSLDSGGLRWQVLIGA
jgi:hypothetical protein